MKEIHPGIFRDGRHLYTVNAVPGTKVYGERLLKHGGKELREWVPERSKLAAALLNGLAAAPAPGAKVLYLGAADGTTVSHVSDIVAEDGIVYAVEFSERSFMNLLGLAKDRENVVPILADARKPELYAWVEYCGLLFADLAQPDQTEITIRNAREFLGGGQVLMAVKSQSIDVTRTPAAVYKEEAAKLRAAGFEVKFVDLEPYERKHAMIAASISSRQAK